MYSFPPVPEDRAGAIIVLGGLGHERRGYAGRSVEVLAGMGFKPAISD